MTPAEVSCLAKFFRRLSMPLFALLDTARERAIHPMLEKSGCEYRILYGRGLTATMDGIGPHLIALPKDSSFLLSLLERGWGNSWGIFLCSPADLQAVRRHLHRLLTVKLPDGKYAHFRYYDPRVLLDYLPYCGPEDASLFFGPISRIYLESQSSDDRAWPECIELEHVPSLGVRQIRHPLIMAGGGSCSL